MTKPIFIVRCPWMKDFPMNEVVKEISTKVQEQLPDYYVLCFTKEDYVDFKFEAHNTQGLDPVDVEGLMKLLTDE